MASRTYSHQELIEHATLTEEDIWQIQQCRRSHNRLGFAYQIGFARLKNRFPEQQPFETVPDLLTFVGIQLKIDPNEIHKYISRQQTISQHQIRIRRYLVHYSETYWTDLRILMLENTVFGFRTVFWS